MKVTCERKTLLDGLRAVAPAAAKGSALEILRCVLVEAGERGLRLAATDLETRIERRMAAVVTEAGGAAVPARLLAELVGSLPDERVALELDGTTMSVVCGRYRSTIKARPAGEFPAVEGGEVRLAQAVLTAETFQEMVSQAAISAARGSSRPILTGILLQCEGNRLTMAAADGYRLSVRYEDLEGEPRDVVDMIVPRTTLELAAKNVDDGGTVVISNVKGRGAVVIDLGRTVVRSQLVEGQFPDYRQIMPLGTTTKVTVERVALARAVKVALLFARDGASIAKLAVTEGGITVVGESNETGDSTTVLEAEVGGQEMGIAFNGGYLVEALGVVETDLVSLSMTDEKSPGMLEPVGMDGRFRYVIMPMHLTK